MPEWEKKYSLESRAGVPLEDPRVVEAVKLFEMRGAIIDTIDALDQQLDAINTKSSLTPKIRIFINERFAELVSEINEQVLEMKPPGETVVRRLAATHALTSRAERAGRHVLTREQMAEIHEVEERFREADEQQRVKPLWRRDLFHPLFLKLGQ